MEKKFLDESTLTYLRNYIDGQDKVIYKTAADLVSSTHLESLIRPATQPDVQVIPSITTTNEQQNLTIGDGLEIKDGALTTKKYVEANPTETGATDLTRLKVGSTVYNIPSGGAGGGETSSVFDLTPYFNLETMSLGSECFSALRDYTTNNEYPVAKLDLGGAIHYFTCTFYATEGIRYSCVIVDGEGVTAFNFDILEGSSSDVPMAILSIPNVAANPSDNGTEELTKLKIGNTTYRIPSGGGSFTEVYRLIFNNVYLDSSNNRYRISLCASRSIVDNLFRSHGLNLDDLKNNFSSYVGGQSLWEVIPRIIFATFDDLYGRASISDSRLMSSLAYVSYFKDDVAYFNFGATSITISSNAYSYNSNNSVAAFGYEILKS